MTGTRRSLRFGSDCLESLADFLHAWPGDLPHDAAVPQEHQGRPKFDVKGSAERLAFAVLDREMADTRILTEQGRQLRPQNTAVRSPLRAEFENCRPLHLINIRAGRLPLVVTAG